MPSEPPLVQALALGPGVEAAFSTRSGGVSQGGYGRLNLGNHVGDAPDVVAENRLRLATALGGEPCYLQQVHGHKVVRAQPTLQTGDAQWSDARGQWLAVLVADCLPVLLVARDAQGAARAVAVAHAGWRGLAGGVLEAAVDALRQAVPDAALTAWLGPCIGAEAFEVGEPVLQAFGGNPDALPAGFRFQARVDGSPRWRVDLQGLARLRLARLGVQDIQAERACTVSDASRFFSFRRDGAVSGRFGAFIRLA